MGNIGTVSFEDIYGVGSLDTMPAAQAGETQQKANPNNSEVTGVVPKGERSIFHLKGNIFGQPIIVWFGFVALLGLTKYLVELKK